MRGALPALLAVIAMFAATPAGGESEVPPGIITTSGVPVAVLERVGPGEHLVLTPCGNEAVVSEGIPISHVEVVLDPGHGGPVDTGAVGANGLAEKEVNLKVAQAAEEMLQAAGVSTVLTRTGDYATPLGVRANFADALGATLMVSIHHNAPVQAPSPTPGVEVFHESASPESRRLGGLIYQRLVTDLSTFVVDWVAPSDAGVMAVVNSSGRDAYGMIRLPETTSVLAELGYIANPAEAEFFARPVYAHVAGRAISQAILDYLETDKQGSGFVEARVFDPQPGVGRSRCVETPLTAAPPLPHGAVQPFLLP